MKKPFLLALTLTALAGTSYSQKIKAIDVTYLDTTVSPGDDFFMYANGGWLKKNPIPPTETGYGSFNELKDRNQVILHNILIEAAADKAAVKGSNKQKIGDFFATAMDSARLNKEGIKPLQPYLKNIDAIKNIADLQKEIARLHVYGIRAFWGFGVQNDLKNSTTMAGYLVQSGLGLPDRDYYTKEDADSKKIQELYKGHVKNMLVLAGETADKAQAMAERIYKIEKSLAEASMTRVEQRDFHSQYNKMGLSKVTELTPSINWKHYVTDVHASTLDTLIVGQIKFMQRTEEILKSTAMSDIKEYMKWKLISAAADYMSDAFVQESFNFNGKVLQGQQEIKPRWKRALQETDNYLGEALGQLYVEKAFSPEAKKKVNEMVDNLFLAYKEHINKNDWMSEDTKKQALHKLSTINRKLGYPDKWRDYSSLTIDRSSYIENVVRGSEFEHKRQMAKLGKPIDRTEWGMTPPTINAYYNPVMNEIVFPAGIMQPPFFNPDADDAVNYGSMGAVIGHELTHAFDDQGAQFDAEGNLKNWWTKEDLDKFQGRTKVIEDQFSKIEALPGVNINGALTLGENIADLGGLSIAYTGFRLSLKGKAEPAKIDGFTADQRFFLGFAQVWRGSLRDEFMKQMIMTNPHSPNKYRVLGTLPNMPEFYQAFGLKESSKMYRPAGQRAKVW